MKLFKIILFIFAVYFIRRFIQMYKVMKALQAQQMRAPMQKREQQSNAINADFKVL